MTREPDETHAREWIMVGIVILGLAGDIASRYFGEAAGAQITSSQITSLNTQVDNLSRSLNQLSDKIGAMPRASEIAALSARMDRVETALGDLQQKTASMSTAIDGIAHPVFRNPRQ